MSYCTAADLRENIAGLTEDNKKAPEDYLDNLIKRKAAYIDAEISQVYKTPVNETKSPIAFQILKDICIDLCRDDIDVKLDVAVANTENNQFPKRTPGDKAKKLLMRIRQNEFSLPDAEPCDAECRSWGVGFYDITETDGIPYDQRDYAIRGDRRRSDYR